MGVRGKLFAAFGASAMLTALAAVIAIYSFHLVATEFGTLSRQGIPAIRAAAALAIGSTDVTIAATDLAAAETEQAREASSHRLREAVAKLQADTGKIELSEAGTFVLEDLKAGANGFAAQLDALDNVTQRRLALRLRKLDWLRKLFAAHDAATAKLAPLVGDAYSSLTRAAVSAIEADSAAMADLLDNQVGRMKSTLEAESSLHRYVALLVHGVLTEDGDMIAPLQDRVSAEAARIRRSMRVVMSDESAGLVADLIDFADPQRGLLAVRLAELDTAVQAKFIVRAVFVASEELGRKIDRLIDFERTEVEAQAVAIGKQFTKSGWVLILLGFASFVIAAAIGLVVVDRGMARPLAQLVAVMRRIAKGDLPAALPAGGRHDEIGDMIDAVAIFRENALDRRRLEEAARGDRDASARRQEHIETLVNEFRAETEELIRKVGATMNEMQATAAALSRTSDESSGQASRAAAASLAASSNVETVAWATGELSASVSEIGNQASKASKIVSAATSGARSTNEKVASLAEATSTIGAVVTLIKEIAEQTNLLALNATIEAARAGEMGRGFAVVASEVKSLASQTARATEEIASQIQAIQDSTKGAVDGIQSIAATMEEVNQYTSSIAAAVEEQGAATNEISQNVHQAAAGTRDVAGNIAGVQAATAETNRSAAQLTRASGDVASETRRLSGVVEAFLSKVAAA
jgi:methyl-accepting chemotaxis protein